MAEKRYWLFKSEPTAYSFSHLLGEADQTAEWDGVRIYQARTLLRDEIKTGDGVLFYLSSSGSPAVVGSASVVRDGYPVEPAWV
ncbi:MAG: EVE domain-containing protein, partial [Dehalococcoidia bacterium]|nr:EVE domain-containing protein [Dehalococcoidia bacterium]